MESWNKMVNPWRLDDLGVPPWIGNLHIIAEIHGGGRLIILGSRSGSQLCRLQKIVHHLDRKPQPSRNSNVCCLGKTPFISRCLGFQLGEIFAAFDGPMFISFNARMGLTGRLPFLYHLKSLTRWSFLRPETVWPTRITAAILDLIISKWHFIPFCEEQLNMIILWRCPIHGASPKP